jgi:[ribosomal protein S5]-alanine N-acetyltransferase
MAKRILETKRLTLEELDETRFEPLAQLLANPRVHKYFPKVLSREESLEFLQQVQERQLRDGVSFWAVLRTPDGAFLGICGLLRQVVDNRDELEVGYRISDEYWGNGYGTEAAAGCMQYAFTKLKAPSVISLILPENLPSQRVAEKNGLHVEKEAFVHGNVHRVYRKYGNTTV